MEIKFDSRAGVIFFLLVVLIFLGFFTLYQSGISLNYLIDVNAGMPGIMVSSGGDLSILGFITSKFSPILIAVLGLVVLCLPLSILAVSDIKRLKYLLIFPIFISGILFNFSILFLFFGLGFFVACLYVVPLSQTYYVELKKWKFFRVGSNAVGKSLMVMFLFVLAGSYIALSTDASYGERFNDGLKGSISEMVVAEIDNMNGGPQSASSGEALIQESLSQLRRDYPNLTEAQYSQMEIQIRESINSSAKDGSKNSNVEEMVSKSLETSPILRSMGAWFPAFFSFSIWASLEVLRMMFLSLISGVFTYVLFKIPFFGERSGIEEEVRSEIPMVEYRPVYN